MHDQRSPAPGRPLPGGGDALMLAVRSCAVSLEVFMHRDFGERYLGPQAAFAFPLVLIYSLLWGGDDATAMHYFLGAYAVFFVGARSAAVARRRRGGQVHSYYCGWPLVMRLLPARDELKVKSKIEPLLAATIGFLLLSAAPSLGLYIVIGSLCLVAKTDEQIKAERETMFDLNDAVLEQEWRAERFRGMHRDRR
ncbi:MAG: hypothetical protein IRY99_06010 [Isosphaeraceae bacterium]|nr:hypothetical protein [Isosphaeraceae bacterium]